MNKAVQSRLLLSELNEKSFVVVEIYSMKKDVESFKKDILQDWTLCINNIDSLLQQFVVDKDDERTDR